MVTLIAVALAACSNLTPREQRVVTGAGIGAAGGAAIGAIAGGHAGAGAAAGAAAGALTGALIKDDDDNKGKSCIYKSSSYSSGSVSCQTGRKYQCSNGSWVALNSRC